MNWDDFSPVIHFLAINELHTARKYSWQALKYISEIGIIIKIIRVELGLGRPSALVEFGASLTIIIPGTHPIFAPTPKKNRF